MNRVVPHQSLFDQVKVFDKWQTRLLFVATLFTIASIVLSSIEKSNPNLWLDSYINFITSVVSILSVTYIALELIGNYKFYKAEKARRMDMIDHAFDTHFSGDRSTGYYNPGGISIGVYKLAVQAFENSFFTSNTTKKMTVGKWIYACIVLAIFLISACLGDRQWVNDLVQIAAAGILVQQALKLHLFCNQMENIHSDFKTMFSNLKDVADKTKNEGEMVKNILNYESTLAWGSTIMDDKIFFRDNDTLSQKWEKMKQDYMI